MIYPNSKMFFPIYKNKSGPQPGPDYSTMPLTFESTGNTTVAINKENLSYKKNDQEWTAYTANDVISCSNNDVVSFSGTNSHMQATFITTGDGTLEVYGNPHSLINWGSLEVNQFASLFKDCTNIVDASNIILSATTLISGCYLSMFWGCSSLTAVPKKLPATIMANDCYCQMFYYCRNLSTIPENYLPATTLAQECYQSMFAHCSNLTTSIVLPATSRPSQCYYAMFADCTKLSSINVNFTNWVGDATYSWVQNVPSGGVFTKPTALTEKYGADYIPSGWTVINK